MSGLNLAMMLIFCKWIGIHRNSFFNQFYCLVLEFWPQNSLGQSDCLILLQKVHLRNGVIFWFQFLQGSSVSWLKPAEPILITDGCLDSLWVSLEVEFFSSLFNVDRYIEFFSNADRQYTNKNRRNGEYQKMISPNIYKLLS